MTDGDRKASTVIAGRDPAISGCPDMTSNKR